MAGTGMLISGALGLGEAAIGLINSGKANKKAKELEASRPKLGPSQLLKDQLSLAESDLSNGMSADAKNAYEHDMDASLSSSLGTITRMGGSPNDVGSVFSKSAMGRERLAIMKDNMRLAKIQNLTRAQDANEEERQKEFQFNEFAPWADAAQANAQAKSNAQSEIFGGLNAAGAAGMRYGQELDTAKLYDKYFGTKSKPEDNSAIFTNQMPRADVGATRSSPAAGVSTINQNAAPNYLDSLLTDYNITAE